MTIPVLRLLCAVAVCVAAAEAPVFAQAPPGRYTPTGSTVHDNKTNLTWQRTPPSAAYSWSDAKTLCGGVGITLGGTGWRLPTVKELLTIVDDLDTNPAIDPIAFPATPVTHFWSSSTVTGGPSVWAVSFDTGFTFSSAITDLDNVRCVRP